MADKKEQTKKDLILGTDFDKALNSAADVQNNDVELCKSRNKNNYMGFYDVMLASRTDIQECMNKKGKAKQNEDKEKIKAFKKETSQLYKRVCELITEEDGDEDIENEESKVEKLVNKISSVVAMMKYIGDDSIEKAFAKNGIKLTFKTLEEQNDTFAQEHIRETMKNVFSNGKSIKEDLCRNNRRITEDIYDSEVPIDLQYDKDSNPTGIKKSDFKKLVEIHSKLMKSGDNEEEQEKIRSKAEKIAGEYVFQNARNDLLNNKMIEFTEEN